MGSWRDYIDRVGVAAVEERFDRAVTPEEYMAVHTALEALVDHLILVPTMEGEKPELEVVRTVKVDPPVYNALQVADIDSVGISIIEQRRQRAAEAAY